MPRRVVWLVLGALAALVVGAAPALASLADDVSAGKAAAAQLQAGKVSCSSLSDAEFEHVGEFVMDRMVGSHAAHVAMNKRIQQAIGANNTDRMHELMGRQFAGCRARDTSGVPMGPGMMGGGGMMGGTGGWGAMMGSSAYSRMRNGSWEHMSSAGWRGLARSMMGSRYSTYGHHGWSTAGVAAVVFGALLVGALMAMLAMRRPWRRRPPAAPSAA